jgi:aminoglycoside 3-N-acetyltransferase
MVNKQVIVSGLRQLGLEAGDVVVVHSSLSCFGEQEGGAETVVDALLEVLGAAGTLVVPTYTTGQGVFDPDETPSTADVITEAVRLRPDAVRSLHPTHSVAAIGPMADVITEGHEKVNAFARGSALFKVLQARGKVLLLGTTHTSNSMVHVAEEIANVGYLDRSRMVTVKNPRGKLTQRWVRRPGCSRGFDVIDEILNREDAIRETMIGECRARLMSARAVVDAAVEALKADPEALLCEIPDCESCAEARAMLAAAEMEKQDREVTELAEEEERLRRAMEREMGGGELSYYDSDSETEGFSPN